jgi:hypothetical protein
MTIWRMRIACWMATNTHSDCVILIDFPLQHWLHGRASVLHYEYIACLFLVLYPYINFNNTFIVVFFLLGDSPTSE